MKAGERVMETGQRTSTYAAGEVVEVVRADVLCQHPADVREGLGRDAERPTGELG